MKTDDAIRRCRTWYAGLLRLYPKPYRERFREGMEQTFNDVCRERVEAGEGLLGAILWMFLETSTGVLRANMKLTVSQNRNVIAIVLGTALILLVPLTAMLFTDEVAWSPIDFACAGVIIAGTGIAFELAVRKMRNIAYRAAGGVSVGTAFILVWGNAAVGVIGDEDDPANLMYFGVVGVGIIGAIIARFQPHGMARALFATATAQATATLIALVAGKHEEPGSSVSEIVFLNGFFVMLWVASALLFRRASAAGSNRDRLFE